MRSASGDPALCIIDCQLDGRGITISGDTHLEDCRVEGFTITNGVGFPDAGPSPVGGAMRINSPATVRTCRLIDNVSDTGGGIYIDEGGASVIEDCVIQDNLALIFCGIFCQSTAATTLQNCLIHDNLSLTRGGGVGVWSPANFVTPAKLVMIGCTIKWNTAGLANLPAWGGGLYVSSAQVKAVNCVFRGNRVMPANGVQGFGGGIAPFDQEPLNSTLDPTLELTNCLIVENDLGEEITSLQGDMGGGGIANQGGALHASNCTIANNSQHDGGEYQQLHDAGAATSSFHNCIFWW
ncbi:MAG: right-handed parallel beta-helix repeat-containing protein, partial [Phycisphaerales bacterium]|nr:right-handed parallel beta-helix repeat-containing protein [Phycisphaerales bacterium]